MYTGAFCIHLSWEDQYTVRVNYPMLKSIGDLQYQIISKCYVFYHPKFFSANNVNVHTCSLHEQLYLIFTKFLPILPFSIGTPQDYELPS